MSDLEEQFASQLRYAELPEPVREYQFAAHLKRRFRFDFSWPLVQVAVEIEGAIYRPGRGAHSSVSGIKRDIEKHNLAVELGWRVLRFHGDQVRDGTALDVVERVLRKGLCES